MLIAGFAYHAFRIPNPLLDLRLYRSWHFSAASIVMFALGAAVFGAMILMPLYWQELRGYSVIETGLLTAPQGLGMAVTMPLAARLTERYGGGPVALVGVVVTAVMTIPFGLIGAHTGVAELCVVDGPARDAGMGASFMPAMTAAFAALDRSQVSHATPQLNVLNRVGGSIGTTILAVVLANALARRTYPGRRGAMPTAPRSGGRSGWPSLAIIPCVVLMRAESNARKAAKAARRRRPGPRLRSNPVPSRRRSRERRTRRAAERDSHDPGDAGRSARSRVQTGDGRRAKAARARDAPTRSSSATRSTALLFGLAGMCERSARELADHADLTPATVAQMLEHLEAAGLVERTRSEDDRRVVLSTLTERGASVVAERQAQMEPRWQAALAEFSDRDLAAAARVLDRLADLFDSLPDDTAGA